MDIRSQKRFIPILIWTAICTGLFLLALYQEKTRVVALPFLTLPSTFGWIASLLVLYLVLVWSVSLEGLVEHYARQPFAQGIYSIMAFQEPGLLVLYTLPVLILSASFGFKGFGAILQAVIVVSLVGMVTWAHFRLGFFIHGSMAKPYFFAAGMACFFCPVLNVVFPSFYDKGPAWLNYFNPFFVLLSVTGPGDGVGAPFIFFFLVFGGATAILLAVPFVLAMPPRLYKDIAG